MSKQASGPTFLRAALFHNCNDKIKQRHLALEVLLMNSGRKTIKNKAYWYNDKDICNRYIPIDMEMLTILQIMYVYKMVDSLVAEENVETSQQISLRWRHKRRFYCRHFIVPPVMVIIRFGSSKPVLTSSSTFNDFGINAYCFP